MKNVEEEEEEGLSLGRRSFENVSDEFPPSLKYFADIQIYTKMSKGEAEFQQT
jgi:hypothetical protein